MWRPAQLKYPFIGYVYGTGAHYTGFPIGLEPFSVGRVNHFYAAKHLLNSTTGIINRWT